MRVRIPIAVTLAAVMAVGSLGINTASAAPLAPLSAVSQGVGNDANVIQVAAKKKRYRNNNANNAAAAAAFMGVVGGMIALSARDRDYDRGYYYNSGYNYDRGYRGYNRGNSGYNRGNAYRSRGQAYQPPRYRGGNATDGTADHRGAPQRAPGGGWIPQNAAPDAR